MKQIILLLSLFFAVSVNAQKKIIVTGGGGATQNLQQVTGVGNVTTDSITIAGLKITTPYKFANNDSALANGLEVGQVYQLPYDTLREAFLLAIVDTLIEDNFDITAVDWGVAGVTDYATFYSFIESWGATNLTITNFNISGGRIRCRIECDGFTAFMPGEYGLDITDFRRFGIEGVTYLEFASSSFSDFDPEMLPSTLLTIDINNNPYLTSFNPSNPLPDGLEELIITICGLTSFDPTHPLPNGLNHLSIGDNYLTSFDPTHPLPNGLNSLVLHGNNITSFNPSEPLPASISRVILEGNDFNSSSVNTVLALFNIVYVKGAGFELNISDQDTPAPPTGDGITWKGELIGRGATITTD